MSSRLFPAQPISAMALTAARIAMTSGVLFVALLALLHVSEYQLGAYGWLMHLAFIALATSLAATGIALWRQARGWLGHSRLLLVSYLGWILTVGTHILKLKAGK